jgi:hypothetical protein
MEIFSSSGVPRASLTISCQLDYLASGDWLGYDNRAGSPPSDALRVYPSAFGVRLLGVLIFFLVFLSIFLLLHLSPLLRLHVHSVLLHIALMITQVDSLIKHFFFSFRFFTCLSPLFSAGRFNYHFLLFAGSNLRLHIAFPLLYTSGKMVEYLAMVFLFPMMGSSSF